MKKDSVASHYKGAAGEEYSKGRRQDVLDHLGYRMNARFFLPYLRKDMHVLDFGCGNGSMAKVIEPHVSSIEAIEINEYPRTIAIREQQLTVYAGLEELPQTKKYDAIISNHVLEHIPNVIDTLRVLYEQLAPGGIFIAMLPIDDFRAREHRRWHADDKNHHLHTWTPLLFGNTLDEAGFKPVEVRVVTHAWTRKLFFLGDNVIQSVSCYLLSVLKKRRQLFALAVRGSSKSGPNLR